MHIVNTPPPDSAKSVRVSGMAAAEKAAEAAARNRPALPAARLVDFGAFIVSETLGSGAYGTVYRGFFEVGELSVFSLSATLILLTPDSVNTCAEQQCGSQGYQRKHSTVALVLIGS
jgi:hypothetical protein